MAKEKKTLTDPLLECLEIICSLENKPFSEDAAKAGLPLVEDRLIPSLFIRAADRFGFSSKTIQTPFEKIDKDRKSTRLNSSHIQKSRMPSSA